MAETEVVRLHGRQALGGETAFSGGCLMALGLPFLGASGLLASIALQPQAGLSVPRWSLLVGAALVLGAGLLIGLPGLLGIRRALRRKRILHSNPRSPWLADGWNPSGTDSGPWKGALGGLAVLVVAVLVLAAINWFARALPGPAPLLVGLLGLALVVLPGWRWMQALIRVLRFGAVRARFERFPFYAGETLEIGLDCRGGFDRLRNLSVTLRHIRVASERTGQEQRAVHYQQWAETQHFDSCQPGEELRVSFPLPAGDFATSIGEPPAQYWEVEVTGSARGVDLTARLPMPVYVRPPGGLSV